MLPVKHMRTALDLSMARVSLHRTLAQDDPQVDFWLVKARSISRYNQITHPGQFTLPTQTETIW
jgi:hypothetical protein